MNPDKEHYRLLRRLRQQIRYRARGAALIYLFSDYALATQWLMAELDGHLRAHSLRLQRLSASAPDASPAEVVAPLLAPSPTQPGMPFWLALADPDPGWDHYRDQVLARLNENRARLESEEVLLILLLPSRYSHRATEVAPDLWSVRSASYEMPPWLPSGFDSWRDITQRLVGPSAPIDAVAIDAAGAGSASSAPNAASAASALGAAHAADADELPSLAMVARWQQQWQEWESDRSKELSPRLAWLLVEQYQEHGFPDMAELVASQAVELCQYQLERQGETPQHLRELSVSLSLLGEAQYEAGQQGAAGETLFASLQLIRRRMALNGGDSDEVQRDLSEVLQNLGRLAQDAGQFVRADQLVGEGLSLRRSLLAAQPDSVRRQAQLGRALNHAGDVARQLGQLERADGLYREALALSRSIVQSEGAPAEALQAWRELSVALDRVGNAARDLGRLEDARNAFKEGLDIAEQLIRLAPDDYQFQCDLAASLDKLARVLRELAQPELAMPLLERALDISRDICDDEAEPNAEDWREFAATLNTYTDLALELGHLPQARQAVAESVAIGRRLVEHSGPSLPNLRALSVSLYWQGAAAQAADDADGARDAFDESLSIDRKLAALAPDSPQGLRDLCASLSRAGELAREAGRLDEARQVFQECLDICRQLRQLTSDSPTSLRDLSLALLRMAKLAHMENRSDEAEAALRESVDLFRQLAHLTGDSPRSLQDLRDALNNAGVLAAGRQRWNEALQAYRESWTLSQRLLSLTEGARASLASALTTVRRLEAAAREAGALDEAAQAAQEAHAIAARLGPGTSP